jgi:hypothetical protein
MNKIQGKENQRFSFVDFQEENNYKQIIHRRNMKKRAQVTAYILVALVIVVAAVIIYFLYPRLSQVFSGDAEPNSFMKTCLGPELDSGLELISKQGGYINPEGYILFENERVKYLCYTAGYYSPCYVQQPLLVSHVEQELSGLLQTKAEECINELKNYYQSRGYEVSGGNDAGVDVSIELNGVGVIVNAPMTFTKETTQSFKTFRFSKQSKIYQLLMTAMSIVDFESTYGNSETTIYMKYYPELQLRKTKLMDGSTVYTVKNVNTDESFTFASRSLAWPGGLGLTA